MERLLLSRPSLGTDELNAVRTVLESGWLTQGPMLARFEELLRARTGRAHAAAVSNGTAALKIALQALGVGPGDEVICPALTWPSPAHAVVQVGARAVLIDVDAEQWNATADAYARARSPKVKAAIVIHQFGVPANVAEIQAALGALPIIEDAACAIGSALDGKSCGSFGTIACLSFHPRKVVTTGEGGACLTDDATLHRRVLQLRNHGQREPGAFAAAGENLRLSDILAALGCAQLTRLDDFVRERERLAQRYRAALPDFVAQRAPTGAVVNNQTFGVLHSSITSAEQRDAVIAKLADEGIQLGRLSYAIHRIPSLVGARIASIDRRTTLPTTERLADQAVALPLYPGMTESDQSRVIDALRRAVA